MYNRTNTLGFAALLDVLVIDLTTELDILADQAPTVRDHFAVLAATKTLINYDVTLPGVQMTSTSKEGKNPDDYTITHLLEVREYFEVKGTIGVSFEIILSFNDDLALVKSTVHVRGVTAAKVGGDQFMQWGSAEKKCLVFEDIDLSQFIPTPKLLGPLSAVLFSMMFNSPYSEDFIEMAELALDFAVGRHVILIEGKPYGAITDHQNYSFYPQRGFHDLIELAALMFLRDQPAHGSIHFVTEPVSSKGTDLFLTVEAED